MAEPDLPGVVLNQEYRVKLGKSFTFPKENAFHTIKYDFKPLSVDHSKPGNLRVGEGDEVNMSLPVVQPESADDVAQFRGPKRPCTRECVLIINTETGEAILEKIGSSVNLKSVRDGRSKAPRDRSISPAPFASKTQAAGKMMQSGKPATSTQDRSKVHKLPVKSRTKKTAESGGLANTATSGPATTSSSLKLPTQPGSNAAKGKKSQKKQPKAPNPTPGLVSDVQSSSYLTLPTAPPKTTSAPTLPVMGANESNPFNQLSNQPAEPAQRRQRLEESSASSSGSSSSSSSGSSDSESDTESPVRHMMTSGFTGNSGGGGGGGVNIAPVVPSGMGLHSLQPPQPPRGPVSMPMMGGGSGNSGGVPISIPLFPVQPSQTGDTSSSSGSESDSTSDSSSSDSSSETSDNEDRKAGVHPHSTAPIHNMSIHPSHNMSRQFSTLEHELSCSSSDSD